jgi:hypothetical protein
LAVHPVQIAQWKRHLLDVSEGIFESGSPSRREREQEQLKVEVDWLRKTGLSRWPSGGR